MNYWGLVGIGISSLALLITALTLRNTNRQLEIEYEPLVVIDGILYFNINAIWDNNAKGQSFIAYYNFAELNVKNVGRGAALNIRINTNLDFNAEGTIICDDDPHSISLASNQNVGSWNAYWLNVFKFISDGNLTLYIHYQNQLNRKYTNRIILKNFI